MKRILSLVVALGVAALFSSAALAGADCNYHKTQASADKTEAVKNVEAVPASDKQDVDSMQTAQATTPAAKAAPVTKK